MDRSTLINTQYRPVTQAETQTDDAASVRAVRDIALGINNAFARACAPHLSDMWPYNANVGSSQSTTAECVVGAGMLRWPAVHCGPCGHYTHAAWSACALLAASSNNCELRLYSAERYYNGPTAMTATSKALLGAYSYDTLTVTSTTGQVLSSGDYGLLLNPDSTGETYFLLTSVFAGASANNTVSLLSVSITLQRSELAAIL